MGCLAAALLSHASAMAAPPVVPVAATAVKVVERAPRPEGPLNPGVVYGDRVLVEDTTWRGEVLVEGALTIAPQATLTIEPGTVIRFHQKGAQMPVLVVEGRIVASGGKEMPILFSSSYATPAAGDWQGVMLVGSEKKNILENCRIDGAQTGLEALFSNLTLKNVRVERSATGMRFQDGVLTMDDGGARGCEVGLSFSEAEATLRNVSVSGNRVGISGKSSSLYLLQATVSGNERTGFSGESCRLKVQGGTIAGNGSGVTLLGCEGAISGAKLIKNRGYGVSLTTSRIRLTANELSGNGENGLMVFDGGSVAWDNAIYQNAGYDLYNAGSEEFRAPGNWWGNAQPKVFDNNGRGKVSYAPVLGARPAAPGE
jgi:hypothetical protein